MSSAKAPLRGQFRPAIAHCTMRAIAVTLALLLTCPAGAVAQPLGREIAVTFDDLPVATKVSASDIAEQGRITAKLVAAITAHRVPAIGFVIAGSLFRSRRSDPQRIGLLRQWTAAGLELGNHSYSHADLHSMSLEAYEIDVARGDSAIRSILAEAGRPGPRWFRHPFLHTGRDSTTHLRLEEFLTARGYRVGPVTVDNSDYVFSAAYEQSLARLDTTAAGNIAAEYLRYMAAVIAYYERQSVALFDREIRQILLLHANKLNADTFGSLAGMLEARGYRFVTLARAVDDPAFQSRDGYIGPGGISWIHRWALTQGKRGAFFAGEPTVPSFVERAATPPSPAATSSFTAGRSIMSSGGR
jgi:peptidoglycan/xylan/chitin deacetylase (PgdA/CDA1 family)